MQWSKITQIVATRFLHYNDLGFPGFAFLRISLELAAGEAPPAAGRDGGTGGPRLMAKRCFVMLGRPERVWICTYLYIPGLVARQSLSLPQSAELGAVALQFDLLSREPQQWQSCKGKVGSFYLLLSLWHVILCYTCC